MHFNHIKMINWIKFRKMKLDNLLEVISIIMKVIWVPQVRKKFRIEQSLLVKPLIAINSILVKIIFKMKRHLIHLLQIMIVFIHLIIKNSMIHISNYKTKIQKFINCEILINTLAFSKLIEQIELCYYVEHLKFNITCKIKN